MSEKTAASLGDDEVTTTGATTMNSASRQSSAVRIVQPASPTSAQPDSQQAGKEREKDRDNGKFRKGKKPVNETKHRSY